MKLEVIYEGQFDATLDVKIVTAMSDVGFNFISSGYNVKTERRDIQFEI